ncbi:putative BsuMI modification methylase subunit YdiP [Streptomyces sp. RB5]|uniref:DNA (cytosine-5-)-methyltransferase n=1 Tax=Streptomyces smaragdinus TaxID=2585196 RepID=A0A7K0CQP6_9ACTN|nr:DNA cytosine methyltransferase [Streptomyces smaragdinus]MQY15789.1 putative BsuMI modification methylase subunit YdiP [Streptomyces smaragdinus]
MSGLRFVEVCAGAGGLALGLEQAGFTPVLLLDKKPVACATLITNRPDWPVLEADLHTFNPVIEYEEALDVDLLAAGLPRVKSSATVGRSDDDTERRLLRDTIQLLHAIQPRALLIENVPDLVASPAFADVRSEVETELEHLGYGFSWFVLNAADFGVPQERKQGMLVALKSPWFGSFEPPRATVKRHRTVGEALRDSMASRGWEGADRWAEQAQEVAPTLVGGSDNHGGADLGPTGTKRKWARMGVNSVSLADEPPGPEFAWEPEAEHHSMVRLTVDQTAILQAFPPEWRIVGKKTARYRQIGHASPPPVGRALGVALRLALDGTTPPVAGYTSAT